MDFIDTIELSAKRQIEVSASAVDLHVSIKGSSLFTGTTALSKAKEVQQLVAAVCAAGLRQEDIKLQGVHAESSSGVFGRSSSAFYSLRLHCPKPDLLSEIMGAVTGQSNAVLERLAWRYPETGSFRTELVSECLNEATANARLMASVLQVELLGVHRVTQTMRLSEPVEPATGPASAVFRKVLDKTTHTPVQLGFSLSHEKIATVEVKTVFRVSGFKGQLA